MRLPPLPEPIYGLGVFFMNDTLFACGGHLDTCFSMNSQPRLHWEQSKKLSMHTSRLLGATSISREGYVFFR